MRPYVRAANITWAGWDLTDVKEMNFDAGDFVRFQLRSGDVLVNEGSGSAKEVGKPAIWRGQIEDCCFQNTLIRVQPKGCTSEYLSSYFMYSALTERFVASTQGVNIHHIGKDGLATFPVPVPPLPEQRRIVAKIDSLTGKSRRARDHLDHVPRLVEKYKQSVLAAAFRGELTHGWRVRQPMWRDVSVADVATLLFDGPFGSNLKSSDYTDQGIRVVRLENIGHMAFLEERRTYISTAKYAGLKRHTLQPDDILVSSFVADEMRVCLFPSNLGAPAINKADCFCIRPDTEIVVPRFAELRLSSGETFKALEEEVHGATRPRISLSQLRQLRFNLPTIEEQLEIVRRIESAFAWIDRLASEATSALRLIDRLDQTVLAKAFRGELVPQDPADEPASVLLERVQAERGAAPKAKRGRKAKA